jgi:uncharacterized membrane protein
VWQTALLSSFTPHAVRRQAHLRDKPVLVILAVSVIFVVLVTLAILHHRQSSIIARFARRGP